MSASLLKVPCRRQITKDPAEVERIKDSFLQRGYGHITVEKVGLVYCVTAIKTSHVSRRVLKPRRED